MKEPSHNPTSFSCSPSETYLTLGRWQSFKWQQQYSSLHVEYLVVFPTQLIGFKGHRDKIAIVEWWEGLVGFFGGSYSVQPHPVDATKNRNVRQPFVRCKQTSSLFFPQLSFPDPPLPSSPHLVPGTASSMFHFLELSAELRLQAPCWVDLGLGARAGFTWEAWRPVAEGTGGELSSPGFSFPSHTSQPTGPCLHSWNGYTVKNVPPRLSWLAQLSSAETCCEREWVLFSKRGDTNSSSFIFWNNPWWSSCCFCDCKTCTGLSLGQALC